MDRDGVDMSVALNIAWSSADLCARTNDYIMEMAARYPDRLAGFGTVPTGSADSALREIERCARGGMKGIGEMRLDSGLLDLQAIPDASTRSSGAIAAHDLLLLLHCSEPVGHTYPGKGDTTPERLYPLIERFPDLKLICAHWGGGLPFYALMPEVGKGLGNVSFDTAASPYLYRPQIYDEVMRILGARQIVFGSDYPLLAAARLLREIRALHLPAETEDEILGGNASEAAGPQPGQAAGPQPGQAAGHQPAAARPCQAAQAMHRRTVRWL